MNSKSIWNQAQNKPTLVVRDLSAYAPADVVYETLLRRGVFKWLAVRRDLVKLKNVWRDRVTKSIAEQKAARAHDVHYWRGYRKAVEDCRAEVRRLCHSERWRAPDFDQEASRWLKSRSERPQ